MEEHAARAHSVLGASSSHRWKACAGSVALEATVPEPPSSPHAIEGTYAHEMAELILAGREEDARLHAEKGGYDVAEMESHVRVYTDYVQSLGGDPQIELRVTLDRLNPPVPMWGTVDTMVWDEETRHLQIVDLKYGQGVVVEVEDNPQLKYYLLGAVLAVGERPAKMTITIVQPRAHHPDGPVRSVEVGWEELKEFRVALMEAAHATQQPDAPLQVGSHCRWCRAKAICPAQQKFALETAQIEFEAEAEETPTLPSPEGMDGEKISFILERARIIEDWLGAVKEYARNQIEAGGEVPGWKLVAGRRSRRWGDETAAEEWLKQRFKVGEVYKKSLVSPAQAEKLVATKPRLTLPDEMVIWQDGKPQLAPDTSPKPAINSGTEFPTLTEGAAQ